MNARNLAHGLLALRKTAGGGSLSSWLRHAEAREELTRWCERSLATAHLVDVAALLHRRLRATPEQLETLGVPTDVLALFPAWRRGSRAGFRPRASGLVAAAAGAALPAASFRVQVSPGADAIPYAMVLLRSLLRHMPKTELAVVVEPNAGIRELRRIIDSFGARHAGRVRLVELPSATAFAQDNALAMRDRTGAPALLIPRAFGKATHRETDALSPERASAALEVRVEQSLLWWEGGNILCDGESLLIGADAIRENMCRLGLTRAEVLAQLAAELGATPTVLGDLRASRWDPEKKRTKSGQADFHIDLDVAPLGLFGRRRKPTVLIADVVRGLELVDVVTRHAPLTRGSFLSSTETAAVLADQYDAHARARHPKLLRYFEQLEALGYRVVGVPDLRVDYEDSIYSLGNPDFGYCNVLPGHWRDRPAVYYLPWGIRALDRAADERFRAAGVEPVRVGKDGAVANRFMRLRGGLHCICGPWR